MFSLWLKRSSLKRKNDKRSLLVTQPTGPSLIMLLSLIGFFIALGVFVMQRTYAAGTLFNM
jgi:hypothetical protein